MSVVNEPKEFDAKFENFSAANEQAFVRNELNVIESATCVRFVAHTGEHDYLEIINGSGCWSWLGRMGGRQELSLMRNGCLYNGAPMHEAIHALGYDHMHNHIDRDAYVSIRLENVAVDHQHNFDKVDPRWFDNFNTPYE